LHGPGGAAVSGHHGLNVGKSGFGTEGTPGAVISLVASPGDGHVTLTWAPPTDCRIEAWAERGLLVTGSAQRGGARVLDVGCGSGILAIAAGLFDWT
jgi:hypothetical protein